MNQALVVDCSQLEGGGQMIRNSFAYSVLQRRPIELVNIRHNRPKPGLAQQHLIVTSLMKLIAQGELNGAQLLSTNVTFNPSRSNTIEKTIKCNVGTAGAISLVIQAILPCILMRNDSHPTVLMNFKGGTNVPFSPPVDHLRFVMLPILTHMGLNSSIQIQHRGFYPIGGGNVIMSIDTAGLIRPISANTPGRPIAIGGVYFGTGVHFTPDVINEFVTLVRMQTYNFLITRGLDVVVESMTSHPLFEGSDNSTPIDYEAIQAATGKKSHNQHSSFGAQLWLSTDIGVPISANVLFEGKKSDFFNPQVAARQLVAQLAWVLDSGACLDEHTADQLVLYMALAAARSNVNAGDSLSGVSEILCAPRFDPSADALHTEAQLLPSSSLHIESAIHIAKLFTGCEISLEVNPITKCRKITVSPPV